MDFNNTLPEWQNTGTEPSDTLKNNGFVAGYKPPANIFNWFWHKVSAAITELQKEVVTVDEYTGDLNNAVSTDKPVVFYSVDSSRNTNMPASHAGLLISVFEEDYSDWSAHSQYLFAECGCFKRTGGIYPDGSTPSWGNWTPFSLRTTINAQTITLSSYRESVDYTFSNGCKSAVVNVRACKNGDTDECVNTMCDVANNKIWFMKPQGIASSTSLSIQYTVTEFFN